MYNVHFVFISAFKFRIWSRFLLWLILMYVIKCQYFNRLSLIVNLTWKNIFSILWNEHWMLDLLQAGIVLGFLLDLTDFSWVSSDQLHATRCSRNVVMFFLPTATYCAGMRLLIDVNGWEEITKRVISLSILFIIHQLLICLGKSWKRSVSSLFIK